MKDLNLIPEYVLEEYKHQQKKQLITVIITLAVLSLLFFDVYPLVEKIILNTGIKTAEAKIQQLVSFENQSDKFSKIKDLIDKKNGIKASMEKQEGAYVNMLKAIEQNIPKRVTVTNANITGANVVELKGYATDELAVADFLSNLRKEKAFEQVETGSLSSVSSGSENDESTAVSYSINFKYVPKE